MQLKKSVILIRDGTRVHQLLMLLACVGEYPMQSVRLLGNDRVWKRRIRELQKVQDFCLPQNGERVRFRMLLVSGKGKMKTIRLHSSALPILKKVEKRAYAYYMDEYDSHHFSGAVTHVGRNHRIAEVVAMCMAAGIPVLPWETRDPHTTQIRCQDVEAPCCYLGKALKLFYDEEMKKTGFTRIAGAIVYPQGIHAVYNTRDQAMLWRGRGEEKAQILLSDIFRTGGFRYEVESALLFGRDHRTAALTLEDAFSRRHLKERLDGVYQRVHFLPMNASGAKMLGILTTADWQWELRTAIYGDAVSSPIPRGLEHDVYMDGVFHYSHLDGDLCSLIRFRRSLRKWPEESFVLSCFPEQVPYLKEYLGEHWGQDNLEIRLYDLDAVHTHFCGTRE